MPKVSKVFKWRHMLPNTYQRVEYIENSWTQYINTGVYPNPDYTTEVKFQNVSFSTFNSFFWCRDWSNSRYYARNDIYDYVWVNRSYSTNSWYEKYTASTPKDYNVHTFKLSRDLYIDWTLVKTFSATQSSTAFPYSIYLFCISSEWTAADFMMWKIFYCKIWNDSGTLIRDMIPCYRKSDSVIWMYDLVNGVFYTNSWTWSFTKWSDVSDLIEYQVYPSWPAPTPTTSFYYDFTNSSLAAIQQDWILGNPSNAQYSTTNWIWRSSSAECSMELIGWINLSNLTKKLKMTVWCIRPNSGWVYWNGFSLSNGTNSIWFHDNWQNVMIKDVNWQWSSTRPSRSIIWQTWYDIYEWDFENNVMKMTPLWLSTYTYTMQTGQVDIVKTFTILGWWTSTMWRKDILIEWE